MNIYVNANFLTKPVTGLERYALELSLAIQNYQNEMTFLTPAKKYSRTYYDLNKLNILKTGLFKNYFWEQIDLPLFLKKNNSPLLINLTNTAPFLYKNQISVIHDLAFMHNPRWYSREAALFFKFIVGKSVSASKHIITVSNFSKEEIKRYLSVPDEKITVIPEGISSTILSLSKKNHPNLWGKYILAVSTLSPRKNLLNLIRAFLAADLNDYKLLIAGASNAKVFNNPELDEFRKNKKIVFLGYQDDGKLAALYQNARLFAYISYYEGFGIPPLEAIVSGTPVLASNVSSMPEVLGDYADYCDPDDVGGISQKILEIVASEKRVNDKIINDVTEKYNWNKSAQMFLETIQKISAGGTVR